MNKNKLDNHITGNDGENYLRVICRQCGWVGYEDDCGEELDEYTDTFSLKCPYCKEEI